MIIGQVAVVWWNNSSVRHAARGDEGGRFGDFMTDKGWGVFARVGGGKGY